MIFVKCILCSESTTIEWPQSNESILHYNCRNVRNIFFVHWLIVLHVGIIWVLNAFDDKQDSIIIYSNILSKLKTTNVCQLICNFSQYTYVRTRTLVWFQSFFLFKFCSTETTKEGHRNLIKYVSLISLSLQDI